MEQSVDQLAFSFSDTDSSHLPRPHLPRTKVPFANTSHLNERSSQVQERFGENVEPSQKQASSETNSQILAQSLERLLDVPVQVEFTDNVRRMISSRRLGGTLQVRLHRMFKISDAQVVERLSRYLKSDRHAARELADFIGAHQASIRTPRGGNAEGTHYHLGELFSEVNAAYFNDEIKGVRIQWSRKPAKTRRRKRSIRLGTYTPEDRLIRIHPALDQAFVPRFAISFVVFHEMLHHVIPAVQRNRNWLVHPPAFRTQERAHPDYRRAVAWEEANLHRLLSY